MEHRDHKRWVLEYIPYMTEHERVIIAYLLARNQKVITAESDGGHANTLISKKILVRAILPGQIFFASDVPFVVPDHIWEVLSAHKESFPYNPGDYDEPYPWRKSWMD